MNLLQPFVSDKLNLKNKLVYPPIRIKRATDGEANFFHCAHYMSFAVGQVGLIIVEECAVCETGRLSEGTLGLYRDSHIAPLKQMVALLQEQGSKVAIQLNHAGEKSRLENNNAKICDINLLTLQQINQLFDNYSAAAKRAALAGFDAIELMASHGFLLSQFLDKKINQRTDKYSDPIVFLTDLLMAVKVNWPQEKAIIIRIGTQYCDSDSRIEYTVNILNAISDLIDIVHISNGGSRMHGVNKGAAYQLADTQQVKALFNKPVIVVGGINEHQLADEILANNQADLIAVGRSLLRNPNWYLEYLNKHDRKQIPRPYIRGFR